jgi:hypothetical protein
MSLSGCWPARAAAVLALAPLAAGCPEVVTEIEIVPGTVAVARHMTEATRFELQARLWSGPADKRRSIVAGSGVKPSWSLSPTGAGVHLTPSADGYRATVEVDPGSIPIATTTVKVDVGSTGAQGSIVSSTASAGDLVEAGYADGTAPDVPIVRGRRTDITDPCTFWLAPSMVRLGTAGVVTAPCLGPDPLWAVALLDPSHGMTMSPFVWTPGTDRVPAPTPHAIRALPIAVRVFVGDGADLVKRQNGARSFALLEIQDASVVLAENRAGISLDLVDEQIVPPPASGDETIVKNCAEGDALTKGLDYAAGVLEVYLVDDLDDVSDDDFADGFACPGTNERPHPVIYLRAGARSVNLVLHEIGHALGLTLPGHGHSDELTGFDGSNVMVSGYAPEDEAWRSRLTVGQVFRMNADPGSWLNWAKDGLNIPLREATAPRIHCQCGADDPDGPCPRVVDDIANPRAGEVLPITPLCRDFIVLPGLGTGDEPVALLAGRQWGTAPDACPQHIAGRHVHKVPTDFIEIANLTRTGTCASWVAIFFEDHAPIFRDLSEMPGDWTDVADIRTLDRTLKPRTALTVHVYYYSGDQLQAKSSIVEATRLYGPESRTGLDLQFSEGTTVPNPCTPPPGDYAVCYSAAGPSVAQLVATELGIPPLTTPEQSQVALAANVMQPVASGSPPSLTLGQLFRVHGRLPASGFPDCGQAGSDCPPIDADVKP